MSYDQGAWDAIGRLEGAVRRGAEERSARLENALVFLMGTLDLSAADRRDLRRILAGKPPYRKAAAPRSGATKGSDSC